MLILLSLQRYCLKEKYNEGIVETLWAYAFSNAVQIKYKGTVEWKEFFSTMNHTLEIKLKILF